VALRRSLGVGSLTFYAVGMILGAGIYSVLGAAAGHAGEALWLAFALGALVAACTGLSYAELATMFPRAGAEYVYIREAMPRGRWPAIVVGLLLILSGASTATTVTLAFGGYLRELIPVWPPVVAAVLLAGFTVMNIVGLRESSRLNIVFTLIEIAGLILVVAIAVVHADLLAPLAAPVSAGVLPAAALVFFAYLGFEEIANLAEESHDPSRNVPRALLISVAFTAVLYVLVALAAVALAPPEVLAGSDAPLSAALDRASPTAARVLGAIALFATANTGLIALVTVSRMTYGMARDGDLPRWLARTAPRRRTPWTAAIAMGAIAVAFLPVGGVAAIASLSSLAALLAFFAVNAAVVVLRLRKPRARRPFRIPGAIRGVPVTAVLGAIASILLATQLRPC
jgi:basic amino acid/polyamine antiporter, APA family